MSVLHGRGPAFGSGVPRPDPVRRFGPVFGVAALACWRVSHLVAREEGPFDVVLQVRARAGSSVLGRLLDCPLCVSVWAAAPLATWVVRRTGGRPGDVIAVWLALSGAASALELAVASDAHEAEVVHVLADHARFYPDADVPGGSVSVPAHLDLAR